MKTYDRIEIKKDKMGTDGNTSEQNYKPVQQQPMQADATQSTVFQIPSVISIENNVSQQTTSKDITKKTRPDQKSDEGSDYFKNLSAAGVTLNSQLSF